MRRISAICVAAAILMFTDSTQLDEINLPFSQRRKLCERVFLLTVALILFLCEICFGRVAQFISVPPLTGFQLISADSSPLRLTERRVVLFRTNLNRKA